MVRQVFTGAAMVAAAALLGAAPAQAVNCKFVLKNLSVGRTVEQVAETMMISEDEIEKCQEEAAEQKKAEGEAAPAGQDAEHKAEHDEHKEAAPSN